MFFQLISALNISLVIPLYNEVKRIPLLQAGLERFCAQTTFPFEIVLVNDGSSDETVAHLATMQQDIDDSKITWQIIDLPTNQGKGAALAAGVKAATRSFVLTLDADMAAEPTELLLWQATDQTVGEDSKQIVIGSRQHPDSNVQAKFSRRFAGGVFNQLVRLMTGLAIRDTQCGFKLYPQAAAAEFFGDLEDEGWAHDIEILLRAKAAGYAIKVMPVRWKHVDDEKISLLKDGFAMLKSIFKLGRRYRNRMSVLQFPL